MTPRYGNPDLVQFEIVQALRASGCEAEILTVIGGGFPDLLVSRSGAMALMEAKSGRNAKLRDMQKKWHEKWKAPVYIVRTIDEALDAMSNAVRKQGGAV